MTLYPVTSSVLLAVGYDEATCAMRIYFHRDRVVTAVWEYEDVSPQKFEGLLNAESPGQHWGQYLRVLLTPKGRALAGDDREAALADLEAARENDPARWLLGGLEVSAIIGVRDNGPKVMVARRDGSVKPLPTLLNEIGHSPDGFEWGYGGSGPSQLAYAIVRLFLSTREARRHYQDFKNRFIIGAPEAGFELDGAAVRAWLGAALQEVPANA